MNPDPQESSPQTPKKEVQIQGPRPPPLRVSKDSHKIKKPPPHPPPKQTLKPFQNPRQQQQQQQQQPPHQPVIIYSVSPKVIHASSASDFMSIVQRLTGSSTSSSSSASYSNAGDLSPAARLASIEKTSPSERDRERANSTNTTTAMLEEEEVEVVEILGQTATHPGILSPAPATLAPIPDGFFSPLIEPQAYSLMHELSPLWHNAFMASPSGLFSAPLVSPSPSSMDLFNHFLDS